MKSNIQLPSAKYPKPVYIVGPTASGKSGLSIEIARRVNSVIISADSMQIFRGLDIGTAKVSKEIRAEIEHKMIDILPPDGSFSVAEFKELASKYIAEAIDNGVVPIIVGGTGLYFEALFYPLSFANTAADPALREKLNEMLEQNGREYMHDYLASLDPQSALRLHVNDSKRVIRALEIVLSTGKPLSENEDIKPPIDNNAVYIGTNCERSKLYARCDRRVEQMFEEGLAKEALSQGSFDHQAMQAIGYKEFKNCNFQRVGGQILLDEAEKFRIMEEIKQHTRNYAKRQLTWFRRYDFIKWFDCTKSVDEAVEYALNQLNEPHIE